MTFLNGVFIGRLRRPGALVLIKRPYTNIIRFIHGWFSSKGFVFGHIDIIFYLSTYNDTIETIKFGSSFGLIEISPGGGYDEPFDMGSFTGFSITHSFPDIIENLYQRIFYLAI